MPATSLAIKTTTTPAEHTRKPRELRVTAKVRTAIEAMVWEGLKRPDAAERAGLTEHSLYVALRRPHVKQAYLRELEVLRTSERARNLHALIEVREQTANQMARVQAVKAIEQVSEESERQSLTRTPGVVIQIINQGPADAKPLETIDLLPNDESEPE